MQTSKIWQFSALILLAYSFGFSVGVEFEQCPHALKNKSCNMTCNVPDFSQIVQIKCNGSLRGSCSLFGCDMIEEGTTKLHFEISSLSYNDSCSWTCIYGSISSLAVHVPIYSGISGSPNLTSQKYADGVKLTATAECLYPYDPSVVVEYSVQRNGQYVSLTQHVDLQSSTTPGYCSDAVERRVTAISDVSAEHEELKGKSVFFRMKFSQYSSGQIEYTNIQGSFSFEGLATPASTNNTDMSTNNTDMSTTVSEATSPPVKTSSSGLSQEIVITIIISIFALGGLVLLIVLVVRQCRQKNTGILAKNKENHFANKEGNSTKKEYLKSNKRRKSLYSEKRNIKQGSSSLDKKKNAQFEKTVPKGRIYQHYPQTIDYWNNCGNQHVFQNSYIEGNMMHYRNWPDNCPKLYSRPNVRMPYQSHNSEDPGHSEGMFQYYRADNVYRGQQMNHQMQYVALKDMHINNKPDSKRSSDRRPYERNWDMLY